MLIMDKVKKYSTIQKSSTKNENLVEKICVTRKKIIKSLLFVQTYQACKYNKSHCDVSINLVKRYGSVLKTSQLNNYH